MSALSIHQLSKTYATGVKALDNVDLTVAQGDFFALLGANGAGKTTIIGIVTGLVNKTAGEIRVFDFDVTTQAVDAKQMIGVVPQEFNFNMFEKVGDIVVDQAGYFGIPRVEAIPEANKLLKQLGLWDKRNSTARTLSGGMKRRLMIARALVHKPKLLILDEPTAGVDIELRRGMWEYLTELNKAGTTIILTTHYLEEAELLCKNVAIIKQGQIVKQGLIKELLKTLEKETYIVDLKKRPKKLKLKNFKVREVEESSLEVSLNRDQNLNDFITELTEHKVIVTAMRAKDSRLEELFLNTLDEA